MELEGFREETPRNNAVEPANLPEFEGDRPQPGDPDYNPFTDPNSPYEGLSADWRPTGRRPIPTLKCTHIKKNGERCGNRGIRGTGLNGTQARCRRHGGTLPNVKKHADAMVDAARLQLTDSTPDAVLTIMELMRGDSTPHAVKLKAATEVLDRVGVKGGMDINVEVTQGEAPSVKFMKKLEDMRKKDEPVLEDLGETDAEEGES